jgi:hypothetical protein
MKTYILGAFLALASISIAQDVTLITPTTPIAPSRGGVTLADATASETLRTEAVVAQTSLATRRLRVVLYIGFRPEDFVGPMPSFQIGTDGPRIFYQGPSIVLPTPDNPIADEYLFEVHHKPITVQRVPLTLSDSAAAARTMAERAKTSNEAEYFKGFAAGAEASKLLESVDRKRR